MKNAVYGGQRFLVMARNPPEMVRYETSLCAADRRHSDQISFINSVGFVRELNMLCGFVNTLKASLLYILELNNQIYVFYKIELVIFDNGCHTDSYNSTSLRHYRLHNNLRS